MNKSIFKAISGQQTLNMAEITRPSNTIGYFDSGFNAVDSSVVNTTNSATYVYLPGAGKGAGVNCAPTHNTLEADCNNGRYFLGMNILYMDGHAKWRTTKQVFSDGTTPWNVDQG